MNIHPARTMPFDDLANGLAEAKAARLVSEVAFGRLRLYCYTQSCVYDRQWTDITLLARGLILDAAENRVVATPFPKFFNLGEPGDQAIPDLPFDTFEKLDGSLIILFHHDGEWRAATKGSFISAQAKWAAARLVHHDLSRLDRSATYLCEAIYPANRIVVPYSHEALVLLAAYNGSGDELPYDEVLTVGERVGWRAAARHHFASISDLISRASILPATEEGFVIRFADGLRLKIKGEEYRRIHALISRCTPLAMWDAMQAGDDMAAIRRQLPEEFWGDFDQITGILRAEINGLIGRVADHADKVIALPDKEIGLRLAEFPPDVRPFIFPYRKNRGDLLNGKPRPSLFRAVRPTGNSLPGYVPSYAMNRIADDGL